MKIYITRHGETKWNKERKLQGWGNSDLTEDGIRNAKKLGTRLKIINFDLILCSPLGRAIDTAKYITGDQSDRIVICQDLKEMGFGVWEGMEYEAIKELYPEQWFNFWNQPDKYQPENGETFEEFLRRIRNVLHDIFKNTSAENILIVTHAAVIKAICSIVKNDPLKNFWDPPFMNDTCLTILEATDRGMDLILEADISHLH